MADNHPSLEVIANDISYIKRDIVEIKGKMEREYVTQDQLDPIRRIVYGLISIILTSVVVAVIALVVKN